jgi:hypothetical protein
MDRASLRKEVLSKVLKKSEVFRSKILKNCKVRP